MEQIAYRFSAGTWYKIFSDNSEVEISFIEMMQELNSRKSTSEASSDKSTGNSQSQQPQSTEIGNQND